MKVKFNIYTLTDGHPSGYKYRVHKLEDRDGNGYRYYGEGAFFNDIEQIAEYIAKEKCK